MLSLSQIEADLKQALKDRNQITADTLRGLKTRIQNAQTAPGRSEETLSESEVIALVRSEVKRRKEAAKTEGSARPGDPQKDGAGGEQEPPRNRR